MSLLIDTNILLWLLVGSPRLPSEIHAVLADRRNAVYLSVASAWEMAIKMGLGKLELDLPPDLAAWLPAELDAADIRLLPVGLEHALSVEALPHHHRDPFDRLIIAQAKTHGLTIVTADRTFSLYDVPRLRAW